ncbi:MAG TPA: thiamine phosphate synthase [Baekduia sp.]|uniref:thiamine phosphate synthase n=1 Tax=Baekduia sp. TaxID=2600305 RepID=UPI002BD8FA3C|nr:thiamine phosphate synthase [Baekduia sp.]HMJ33224.1 thiamine phosphate synthase [Baekduia sp.]
MDLSERRARLARARLYLICDAAPGGRPLADVLVPALRGGVDLFQLRMKGADDATVLAAAAVAREACAAAGALFVLNDRPDLAAAAGADGAHVGQDDLPVARARELAGPDRLIGRSTHSPAQVEAGAGADYLGVGPVHATPTKPGRAAVGLDLVAYAAAHAAIPFFAIGGLDAATVGAALDAGATRVAIVRAIAEAADPEAAARALRARIDAVALPEPHSEDVRGATV